MKTLLTPENYSQGFLVDEHLMGGITQDPDLPQSFVAFILQHTTGKYVGYQSFPNLALALEVMNRVQRSWTFERLGGCGKGQCSQGNCGAGKCTQGSCGTGSC